MKSIELTHKLDLMIDNPHCELNYNKPFELVIAVMLSAQCTDKRVNMVTESLFKKYSLVDLANIDVKTLEKEIMSLGSYTKKAKYIKDISFHLLNDFNGDVPNDRDYLESLDGVGRKSANVILSELYDVPTMAVDTHVARVSKRLELVKEDDDVLDIEKKLMKYFKTSEYNKANHQLLLFGRYICKAKSPDCDKCLIKCNKMIK